MAHRFRGISFADGTILEDEELDIKEESFSSDITDEVRIPLIKTKRVRRYTEQPVNVSDAEYQNMAFQNERNQRSGRSKSLIFGDEDVAELHASLVLPSLSLTTNSKFQGYVDEKRKRTSTVLRPRSDSVLEKSFLISYTEQLSADRGATVMLAIWNLLPLLQGSSVFSMPYTVISGGYLSLLWIPIISLMANFTGSILVDCLYEISPRSQMRKRVRKNYADIALSVWGKHGARLLNVILVFYLFTGDVVNIVLLAKSVYDILSPFTTLSFAALTAIFSILCYPTLFITRLTILAYLSLLSIISAMVGIIAVIVVFFMESGNWSKHMSDINVFNAEGFPLAASIIMFSCLTHSVLPQVEGNMAENAKINKVINISYSVSTVTKLVVAFLGAITFGTGTQSIITLNVSQINIVARYVCAIALIGFSVFNYPLNLFVVCENVDSIVENTEISKKNKYYYPWLLITRLLLVVLTVVVALVVPYFGLLLAIRGSLIGTCLIFLFPCYFHLKLKWRTLTKLQKIMDFTLMIAGTIIGLFGLYSSSSRLISTIKADF